jgi:hypothetical protein
MTALTTASRTSGRGAMTGPWLLLTVSKAALEFDKAIEGKGSDFLSARRLAEYLKQTLPGPAEEGVSPAGFDVGTVGVVGRALEPQVARKQTIAEIVNKAWQLAEKMEKTSEATDRQSLEQFRGFCVAFSNGLVGYRDSLASFHPTNPFKR